VDTCLDRFKKSPHLIDLKHSKIHLVHVFELQHYTLELAPVVFPTNEQVNEIATGAIAILQKLGTDLGIAKENLIAKCYFEQSTENKVREYCTEIKADLIVIATRGKHGLDSIFSNSLTEHLCKYSPCDVLVLRPQD
jgi:nucleotide-binding universal stress UspA family protein